MILNLTFLISLISFEQADFILIEYPQNLVIYNKYQQLINDAELKLFTKNLPFKIIERDLKFNDQINFGMKVEFNGEIFYFGKNEKGHLLQFIKAGKIEILEKVEVKNRDIKSLQQLTGRTISNQQEIIKKGSVFSSIITTASKYYVRLENEQYVWLTLKQSDRTKSWDFVQINIEQENFKKLFIEINQFAKRYSGKVNASLAKMDKQEQKKLGRFNLNVISTNDKIELTLENQEDVFKKSFTVYSSQMKNEFSNRADIEIKENKISFRKKVIL